MPVSLRRASRWAFATVSFAGGAALAWYAVRNSPILAVATTGGMGVALWWLKRRERSLLGQRLSGVAGQDLALAVMLMTGLWLGVYAVFSLGDVGLAAGRATSLPIGADARPLTMGAVLTVALAATLGIGGLLAPFRRPPRRRRDLRETALVGKHGAPREVSLTPRTSQAVDRDAR